MRSIALRAARGCLRGQLTPSLPCRRAAQGSRSLSVTAARRDEERQWSTPLAKQLAEAISVCEGDPSVPLPNRILNMSPRQPGQFRWQAICACV